MVIYSNMVIYFRIW